MFTANNPIPLNFLEHFSDNNFVYRVLSEISVLLGLARVMSHLNRLEDARKFYEEVFKMAPMLHEAYIEAGSIIAKKDPMGKKMAMETETRRNALLISALHRILNKRSRYWSGY